MYGPGQKEANMTSWGLTILDETACFELLCRSTLGRVGVRLADDFTIFPVFYAVVDHNIVFRTGPGTKLTAAVLGTRVVFEVDDAAAGWSVLVRGHARELRDTAAIARATAQIEHDWPAGVRESYVWIEAEKVTGRKLPDA